MAPPAECSAASDEEPSLDCLTTVRTEAALANIADLKQKALSQHFSAAWADEWNPNPLSDLSV